MDPSPRLPAAVTVFLAIALLWTELAPAADAPPADAGAKEASDKEEDTIREQSIYIPYEKLRDVFEKQGRGVFLPYEKFQELWRAAQEKTARPVEPKPPVGALLSEIESEAVVSADVVRVTARVKIEVLAEGWNQVPLRLADAAITKATLRGQPARIISDPKKGHLLLVEKQGKKPEEIELLLEYAKKITKRPGQNSVSFQAPQAPVSRWRVRIPEAGVKVNIQPMIAATEVPLARTAGDEAAKSPKKSEETVVLAFIGAAPTVRIDWTPKAEGARGLEALASVQAEQQVLINEGVVRTRTMLAYTISRAEIGQLIIEVPADQKVQNVFDANVRQWSVEPAGEPAPKPAAKPKAKPAAKPKPKPAAKPEAKPESKPKAKPAAEGRKVPMQRITVELFEPAKGAQRVSIELVKYVPEQQQGTIQIPVVKARGVGRQQGVVVVQVAEGLRAEVAETSGLLQVDAAELPRSLAGGKWGFSYRYAAVPFELALGIEKVKPRILVDSLVEAHLQPERLGLDMLAVYTVQRAGVFRLELDLPAGYEVRRVEGRKAAGATAAQIDTHHLEGDDKTRLVVNLSRKAFGKVGLAVALEKKLRQPDLLTPTGKEVEIPLAIPRVAAGTVQQDSGRLVVYAPESLKLNPGKSTGLKTISLKEALEGMEPVRKKKAAGVRAVLEFSYAREPVSLVLGARRREPEVTIRQLLVARVDSGVVKYEATFFYKILYSGVESLRIDVPKPAADTPAEDAPKWRNISGGIRDSIIDPEKDKPEEGYEAWSFSGQTELIGEGKIELVWKKDIKRVEVGRSVPLTVPRLKPRNVYHAWGQIVLAKAETIDLAELEDQTSGLRPIDPAHDLMSGVKVEGAARAFEFTHDWQLGLRATVYRLEEIKRTSIDRAVVRMVVTRAGQIPVQALYRVRSARQRLEVELPEGVKFDSDPVRINGSPVALQSHQGQPGKYSVPLVGVNTQKPFVLELRYTVPGEEGQAKLQLDLPEFPEKPALQKVHLCVYLPEERALLGASGPWREQFGWRIGRLGRWKPVCPSGGDADSLIGQVMGGVRMAGSAAGSFQTDGLLYVFSTLHPQPPPAGSLHLRATGEKRLAGIVFAVIVIGGLLLLPAGVSLRAFCVGLLIVALVLSGVFYPIFAMQILDFILALAILVVLVIWVVCFFVWTVPRRRPPLGRRPAAAERPSTPPAADRAPAQSPPAEAEASAGQQPVAGSPPDAAPPAEESPRTDEPKEKPGSEGQEGGSSHA